MAAEAVNLLEKYSGATGDDPSASIQLRKDILLSMPHWESYEATKQYTEVLNKLEIGAPAQKTKEIMGDDVRIVRCLLEAVHLQDVKPMQWILTFLYELLREDSSCFSLFEDALKQQIEIYKPLMKLLAKTRDTYAADKTAWLVSAVIGQVPGSFTVDDVKDFLEKVLEPKDHGCSELGQVEAITNLLKSDTFRSFVWGSPRAADTILKVLSKASSPLQYRGMFALWMLSFDSSIMDDLKKENVIKKLKGIVTATRTEKVVRLCLTVLRNFLQHRGLCEDIVEEGVLEAVQNLEFEKWRDAELYDDIRDMAAQISSEVHAMSNFERYERELQTGVLRWGFIHSTKFWAENVLKFEQNDFRALKVLAGLLMQPGTEPTTLAVACHDLGEFVTMHPLGKKKVAQMGVKDRIMQLMGSNDQAYREVRREALLCCQKIMLNKWHEMDTVQ